MKKQLITLVIHALLPILLSCGLAAAEETPQLLKVKHSTLSPTSEQIVLQLNGSYSPKIFTLKDENPRVVFDFAAMTLGREVKSITTTDGSIVKRIRVGAHGDDAPKTRIVFDVATLKGVTYTQQFDKQSSSLVIRFTGPAKVAAPRNQEAPAESAAKEVNKAVKEPAKPPEPPTQIEAATPAPVPPAEPAVTDKSAEPVPPPPVTEPVAAAKPAPVKPEEKTAASTKKEKAAPSTDSKKAEQPAPVPAAQAQAPAAPTQPEAPVASKAEKPTEIKAEAPPVEAKKDALPVAEATGKHPQPETTPPSPAAKVEGEKTAAKEKTDTGKTDVPLKTADNPQLESIRFDPSSPKGEMVLFKLNGFHPPAVHGVEEGIPRVICDFNNTKLVDGTKSLIKTDGKFVKVIRTSKTKKPEKVRVVIDLEPNRSYDLQQVFFKEDNLFVLIVNTVKK